MSYTIIRNDITRVTADAIVNTANPHARIGAGTDTAIHRAAGPELLEARKKIGDIPPGEAAVTPAFHLNAQFVIHAVSPVWRGGNAHEEEILRRAYDNALQAAIDNGCRSVAFPLMAAGSYGFPREKAMSIAISAFTDFLMVHDIHIILVVFNQSIFELAGHLFDDLRAYVDENYVAQAHAEEYGPKYNLSRYDDPDGIYRREIRRRRLLEDYSADAMPMAAPVPGSQEKRKSARFCGKAEMSLDELVDAAGQTFHQALFRIIDERGLKDSQVYLRAEISKQQFSKIRGNVNYQPTKSLALRLAVALELDYEEAQALLGYAGYTLSGSNLTDIIVGFHLRTRNYNKITIDSALFQYGQPALFSEL